ncbi:hypothetical protein M404DRAFT_1004702 [Pisolithus tinctorius Marx 270]|uniref:Uncharacterized protein n=1 Tax=Pisolithus tinctorius Marx 270 TaxID=870435 RepID=A0A0C3NEB3_PISTI|nr:hypothetical protein M404DRAFT_1004702 [Pisolithus tinctorius Marx 270]
MPRELELTNERMPGLEVAMRERRTHRTPQSERAWDTKLRALAEFPDRWFSQYGRSTEQC